MDPVWGVYILVEILDSIDVFPFPCLLGKWEKLKKKNIGYKLFSESGKKEIELVDSQNKSVHTFWQQPIRLAFFKCKDLINLFLYP